MKSQIQLWKFFTGSDLALACDNLALQKYFLLFISMSDLMSSYFERLKQKRLCKKFRSDHCLIFASKRCREFAATDNKPTSAESDVNDVDDASLIATLDSI